MSLPRFRRSWTRHPTGRTLSPDHCTAASRAPGESDVVAAIVLAEGRAQDAAAIFAACRDKLEPNFVPSYLQVLDEIPKTASEKPQERILLQQFDSDAANVYTEQER